MKFTLKTFPYTLSLSLSQLEFEVLSIAIYFELRIDLGGGNNERDSKAIYSKGPYKLCFPIL